MKNVLTNEMQVRKYIKQTFKNSDELYEAADWFGLNGFVINGRELLEPYKSNHEQLKEKYESIYNSLVSLPVFTITKRYGRETHQWNESVICYIANFGQDAERRIKLFKVS